MQKLMQYVEFPNSICERNTSMSFCMRFSFFQGTKRNILMHKIELKWNWGLNCKNKCDWYIQFLEVQAQHAFIRDEQSKGRWDAALTRSMFSFMLEVFERTVGRDLGPRVGSIAEPEHVC